MRAYNAALIGEKKPYKRFLIGASALRADGCWVTAHNEAAPEVTRQTHAEYRLSRKIGPDAIVFVVRVRRDGSIGCAKPCPACEKVLRSRKVSVVYYTTENGTYRKLLL